MKAKVILFDADGVLTLPEEVFSVVYARSHGFQAETFEKFFKTEWNDFVIGRRDLKEHIRDNPSLWQWDGTPDELLDYWFKSEDIRNDEMIELVKTIHAGGTPCYLATEQEKYRGNYMRDVMFKDLFDGYFITAEIGLKKSDPKFFEYIVKELTSKHGLSSPTEIVFFDDSRSKVDAAKSAGLTAHLFTGVARFKEDLELG